MEVRSCCHVATLTPAIISTAVVFLLAALVVVLPRPVCLLSPCGARDQGAGSHGQPEESRAGGTVPMTWPNRAPPAGPLAPSWPAKHRRWEDEERTLLRRTLRPRHVASNLDSGATGRRGGATSARREQPRRSLFRPAGCSKRNSRYPNASYPDAQLLTWQPRPDRYLLAVCHFGQLSNQIMCMDNYFLFAALLNRTLVIPPSSFARGPRFRWEWDYVIDRKHANACFRPGAVISLDELRARLGTPSVRVDAVACLIPWGICTGPKGWEVRGLNLTLPPGPFRVLPEQSPTPEQLRSHFEGDNDARVITVEDLYIIAARGVPHHRPFYPLRTQCPGGGVNYMRAHPAIWAAARGFAREVLGGHYLALHFRRGDFHHFCRDGSNGCFWPAVTEVHRQLAQHAARFNFSQIYIATNAHLTEIVLLQKLLNLPGGGFGRQIEIVMLPELESLPGHETKAWAREWLDLKLDDNVYARALLDKLVCVHGTHFLGTRSSTYSYDITRIRWAEGFATCEDGEISEAADHSPYVPINS